MAARKSAKAETAATRQEADGRCGSCRFFGRAEVVTMADGSLPGKRTTVANAACHRYPTFVPRAATDFCGEYQAD